MFIKSEEYFNEIEQKQYIKKFYGLSEDKITFIEDRPVECESIISEPTQLDRLEANTDYLVMINS